MKKQLILLLAIFSLSLIACDRDDEIPVSPRYLEPTNPLTITNFYPESAKSGGDLTLYGENFGQDITDNFVTINNLKAKIVKVPHEGMVVVRVPLHLAPGEYNISLSANGQTGTASKALKVISVSDSKF